MLQPSYHQQPFYASVTWPQAGYLDISSVFQVNGLAPQTFKHPSYRTNQRPRKPSRQTNQSDQSSQGPSQGGGGGGVVGGNVNNSNQTNSRPTSSSHVPPSISPQINNSKTNNITTNSSNNSSKGPPVQNDVVVRSVGHNIHNISSDNHDAHTPSNAPIGECYKLK